MRKEFKKELFAKALDKVRTRKFGNEIEKYNKQQCNFY